MSAQTVESTPKIELPDLLQWQHEVHVHPARFKVICIGRQAGKTRYGSLEALKAAIEGKEVLWVAPTISQSNIAWNILHRLVQQIYPPNALKTNVHEKIIEWKGLGGGKISFKTADNPDNLRGFTIDLAILDEAAFIKSDTWTTIRPALEVRRGKAIFLSTPRGKNLFYEFFLRGKDERYPEWASWQLPSSVNPFLPKDVLEEAKNDLPLPKFQAEYLAQFTADTYTIFRNIFECVAEPATIDPDDSIVFGVDWGKQHDYTVITVYNRTKRAIVAIERFNKIDYRFQRMKLETMAKQYDPDWIICEANSIGEVNIEELRTIPVYGKRIKSFYTTNKSKRHIIESLALAFTKEEIQIINHRELLGELERFQMVQNPNTGVITYSAPDGFHDDCVMSLAIAYAGEMAKPEYRIQTFDRATLGI